MKKFIEKLNVGQRLMGLIGLGVIVAVALTALGLIEHQQTKASFKTVYEDRMVPIGQLTTITENQMDINQQIGNVLSQAHTVVVAGKTSLELNKSLASEAASEVEKLLSENDSLWKAYMATYLTPEEKVLAGKFEASYQKYVTEGINPALMAIKNGDVETSKNKYTNLQALDVVADDMMKELTKLQFDVAKQEFDSAEETFKNVLMISAIALASAISPFSLDWLCTSLKSITLPLKRVIGVFGEIENGQFDTEIEIKGKDELSQVLGSLMGMRTRLAADILKQQAMAKEVKDQAILFQAQLDAISKSTGMLETGYRR